MPLRLVLEAAAELVEPVGEGMELRGAVGAGVAPEVRRRRGDAALHGLRLRGAVGPGGDLGAVGGRGRDLLGWGDGAGGDGRGKGDRLLGRGLVALLLLGRLGWRPVCSVVGLFAGAECEASLFGGTFEDGGDVLPHVLRVVHLDYETWSGGVVRALVVNVVNRFLLLFILIQHLGNPRRESRGEHGRKLELGPNRRQHGRKTMRVFLGSRLAFGVQVNRRWCGGDERYV